MQVQMTSPKEHGDFECVFYVPIYLWHQFLTTQAHLEIPMGNQVFFSSEEDLVNIH